MKKILFLSIIFSITLFSCHLDGMFDGDAVFSGNTAQFIKDGYSIPVIGTPEFTNWEIPKISDKKMFQVGGDYNITFKLVNPGKLSLTYKITTDKPEFFDTAVDTDIIGSGIVTEVKNDMKIPFRLKDVADKNDISFKMYLSSSMRSYVTPEIKSIYVNTKPSKIIPKADQTGSPITNNSWQPVVENNKIIMYWDFVPSKTDNDISHLTVYYSIGEEKKSIDIKYDSLTKKFGSNSFELYLDDLNKVINFSVEVYDSEGLGSEYVSSAGFLPSRAELPDFTRNSNTITMTPKSETVVYYKFDDGEILHSSVPVDFILTKNHKIEYYSTKIGLLDSKVFVNDYLAQYTVTYNDNNATIANFDKKVTQDYNTKIPKPSSDPLKTGFAFNGWYKEAECINPVDFDNFYLTNDITLYAMWIKSGSIVVTLETNPEYQSLVFTPSQVTSNQGVMTTITTSSNFSSATEWKWYENNILQVGQNTSSYTFNSTGKVGVTTVYCSVKLNGVLYSGTVRITVQ
ncbi:MAG TPA: InlB B-repeat-containing protein [Spirochaetota bacterium]|nr:InlB B-repeat-containing protein [Spirochaetota bacterium]